MELKTELNKGLRLPKLISDGMVLQRGQEIKIWGKIEPGTFVDVTFAGYTYTAVGNAQGKWTVVLPPLEAGGPYNMVITTSRQKIVIKDILIGDIWLCGGQSNMELPINRVMERYREEVNSYENTAIRMFHVPMKYEFNEPQEDLESGRWQVLDKENVLDFTALGYFFAKALFEQYHVPIGLIHTAIGGTPVQAWMSEEALKDFPIYLEQIAKYKDEAYIESVLKKDAQRINTWYNQLNEVDLSFKEREQVKARWYEVKDQDKDNTQAMCKDGGWKKCEMPNFLIDKALGEGGSVWFRKEIQVPEMMAGKEGRLLLGTIVDNDSTYINGTEVGTTSYRYPPRIYTVPLGTLKAGKNAIVVRVCFERGEVGFTPDKPCRLEVGGEIIDLQGEWQYKIGAKMEALAPQTFIQYEPMGLYNGMIYPLKDMKLKGVIWYQGESNTHTPQDYKALFEGLMKDWRNTWRQEDLPFIYVQLPNFATLSEDYYTYALEEKNVDCIRMSEINNGWSVVRQAQLEALEMPYTAMVVAIDAGEWNDLHPLNKKVIGERLARAARAIAYNEEIIYCSPLGDKARVEGDKVIVSFKHIGSGLMVKGDVLNQFIISADGEHFYKAKAELKDNEVIVWHDEIKMPIEVRYAWADHPEGANLYSKEGLPASPFKIKVLK